MRRSLEKLLLVPAVMAAGPLMAADTLPPSRQQELLHLVRHDCGSCHGLTMKGGLGAPLLPAALEGKADEALVAVILDGIRGTPMPPWRGELTPAEAGWIVRTLRGGLDHVD